MRLFVKLMMAVLVVAFAGLFFVRDPAGRPVLTVSAITRGVSSAVRHIGDGVAGVVDSVRGSATADTTGVAAGAGDGPGVSVYRWQDADGIWHYSDQPPPAGATGERVEVDPDRNVVSGFGSASAPSAASSPAGEVEIPAVIPGIPSPQAVKQLLEDAREVQEVLDERARAIDEAARQGD